MASCDGFTSLGKSFNVTLNLNNVILIHAGGMEQSVNSTVCFLLAGDRLQGNLIVAS